MSQNELTPLQGGFNAVKFTPATFEYPADMFDALDDKMRARFSGVKTEFKGQWKSEIAELKQFIDGGKASLKNMETALLADFYTFSGRAKRSLKLAESFREELKNGNDAFVQIQRDALITEVDSYVQSKDWGDDVDPRKFVYPDWFGNLTAPFSEKVAELDKQASEIKAGTIKTREDILAAQKWDKEQALNYELIIKKVGVLNQRYNIDIPASEFVNLKVLHPVEAEAEIEKYFEFLAKDTTNSTSHSSTISIVLEGDFDNVNTALDVLKKHITPKFDIIKEIYGVGVRYL